jgi:hypothetical protein
MKEKHHGGKDFWGAGLKERFSVFGFQFSVKKRRPCGRAAGCGEYWGNPGSTRSGKFL